LIRQKGEFGKGGEGHRAQMSNVHGYGRAGTSEEEEKKRGRKELNTAILKLILWGGFGIWGASEVRLRPEKK